MQDSRIPVLRSDCASRRTLRSRAERAARPHDAPAILRRGARNRPYRISRSATASRPTAPSGPGTRAAMNVPVAARIDQIRINLERARWTLHEIKGEFVLVDVAGFYVSYFRNDEPIWTSRVVVGRDRARDADLPLDDHVRRVQPDVDDSARHPGQGQAAGAAAQPGRAQAHEHPRARRQRPRGRPVLDQLAQVRAVAPAPVPVPPGSRARTMHWASSRSCSPTRTWFTCTTRRPNRCTTRTSARSARVASACRSRSSWQSWC